MIQLRKLFTPVSSMDPDEAREYLATHPEGSYTLLDVRQPWEFEEEHLPGGRLLPLPQLKDMYKELDPDKPTLVHCAIGGRSRVAAQFLSGWGFKEVYNLSGGIKAFQGHKATGPEELNLGLIRGDETPQEILTLAYGMEKGLQTFYETIPEKIEDPDLRRLAAQLARVEVQHEKAFFDLYKTFEPETDLAAFEATVSHAVIEGGFDMLEFLKKNEPYLQTVRDLLEVAMM
ncbi:MAG: sulfurtransferase, partial [Deltaproteobacteria bacterium]|nr:sulfurtransferase [Deltaproteobacteria bacterium]